MTWIGCAARSAPCRYKSDVVPVSWFRSFVVSFHLSPPDIIRPCRINISVQQDVKMRADNIIQALAGTYMLLNTST